MKNTNLVLLQKKFQNYILMKNFVKEKIQISILMKNTDLVLLKKKNFDMYFNEKYRFDFVKENKLDLYFDEKYRSSFAKVKF